MHTILTKSLLSKIKKSNVSFSQNKFLADTTITGLSLALSETLLLYLEARQKMAAVTRGAKGDDNHASSLSLENAAAGIISTCASIIYRPVPRHRAHPRLLSRIDAAPGNVLLSTPFPFLRLVTGKLI